jgi:hypothetical protein
MLSKLAPPSSTAKLSRAALHREPAVERAGRRGGRRGAERLQLEGAQLDADMTVHLVAAEQLVRRIALVVRRRVDNDAGTEHRAGDLGAVDIGDGAAGTEAAVEVAAVLRRGGNGEQRGQRSQREQAQFVDGSHGVPSGVCRRMSCAGLALTRARAAPLGRFLWPTPGPSVRCRTWCCNHNTRPRTRSGRSCRSSRAIARSALANEVRRGFASESVAADAADGSAAWVEVAFELHCAAPVGPALNCAVAVVPALHFNCVPCASNTLTCTGIAGFTLCVTVQ